MKKVCGFYNRVTNILAQLNWLPPFLARVSIGSVFIVSGWGKLHNIQKVIGFFTDLGIPFPDFQAHLVAVTEFTCGGLILLGVLTRLASIPLIITMIVAILTAKKSDINGITDLLGTDEFIYIVFFIWFVVSGAGKVSFDSFFSKGNRCRITTK